MSGRFAAIAGLVLVSACLRHDPLRVDSVVPSNGPQAGGTSVLVRGKGFGSEADVFFGGAPATQVTVVDSTTIQARTPPGRGNVDVEVRSRGRLARLTGGFTYTADEEVGCRVSATTPGFGANDVAVGDLLTVSYDASLGPRGAAVELARLEDGTPVPASVAVGGDGRSLVVTPATNLRFWGSYTLVVDGVRAADGRVCEPLALAFATRAPAVVAGPMRPAAATDVVVLGTTAVTASPSYRGLQVYDVTTPASPVLLRDVPLAVSPSRLAVEGNRLYAAAGSDGVLIFEITDPRVPRLVGVVGTGGSAADVAPFARGAVRWLAVADGARGVRLYDASNAALPGERASIHTGGTRADSDARGVAVRGDQLWIAGGRDGLFVYSIAAPGAPSFLGALPSTPRDQTSVAPHPGGRWVYAGRSAYGLDVVDALDPTALVVAQTVHGADGPCGVDCKDLFVRLVLDGTRLLAPTGLLGVTELAVAGDGTLSLARVLPTGGPGLGAASVGELVYAASPDGLSVWPAAGTTPTATPTGGGLARALAVDGDLVYLAAASRGLETWRLEAGGPTLLDRDATPGTLARRDVAAVGVTLRPGQVLVGDGRLGVDRFLRSDLEDPVFAGGGDPLDTTQLIEVDESRQLAFACAGNLGIAVFDIAGNGAPVQRALLRFDQSDGCSGLVLSGTTLYVGGVRLWTANVSDPALPVWASSFPLAGGAQITGLARAGSRLVASTIAVDVEGIGGRRRTLQVYSLADPVTPALVAQTGDVGGAGVVKVAGGKAFVAAGSGVFIFDLAPEVPFLEGVVPTRGQVADVFLVGPTLHTAELAGGLRAISLGAFRP